MHLFGMGAYERMSCTQEYCYAITIVFLTALQSKYNALGTVVCYILYLRCYFHRFLKHFGHITFIQHKESSFSNVKSNEQQLSLYCYLCVGWNYDPS